MKIYIDPYDEKLKSVDNVKSLEELRTELIEKVILGADAIRKKINDDLDQKVTEMLGKFKCPQTFCTEDGNWKNPYKFCNDCAEEFTRQFDHDVMVEAEMYNKKNNINEKI